MGHATEISPLSVVVRDDANGESPAEQELLTRQFLMSSLRKPILSNLFDLAHLCNPTVKDNIRIALEELRPTFFQSAGTSWTKVLFGTFETEEERPEILTDVNPGFVEAVLAFQGWTDTLEPPGALKYCPVLEFFFSEIVYEDGLNWQIPVTILGSDEHQGFLEDFDPGAPRKWSFDNIWHEEHGEDPWHVGPGARIPDFGKPETVFWFLAMFERMYALGFRAFLWTQMRLMLRSDEELGPEHLARYEWLKYTVRRMRNWALYQAPEAPHDGLQVGDAIIIGTGGGGQACAFPDDSPFCSTPRPLFDYHTVTVQPDLAYMTVTELDENGQPVAKVKAQFEQRNYRPWFGKWNEAQKCLQYNLYPTANRYSLPVLIGIDNGGTVDDITWFGLLTKRRRDYNLALMAFEFAKMREQTYFVIPFKVDQGEWDEWENCYGEYGDRSKCRLCLDDDGKFCSKAATFYEIYRCGQLATAKDIYAWSDDITGRPEGVPKAVFWIFDQSWVCQERGDLTELPGKLYGRMSSGVRNQLMFALGEWGPQTGCYLAEMRSMLILRDGQYWFFNPPNWSSFWTGSVKSLLVGCPPSCETYHADPRNMGANQPGLQQHVFAWEGTGPDNIVCLPPTLALTGCTTAALVIKDGNVWLQRGMCWGETTKIRQLLELPRVDPIREIYPWSGKGPDAITYMPAADGGHQILVLRSGRFWRYKIRDVESLTNETAEHPLERAGQGWLKELLCVPNTIEDLLISGTTSSATGEDLEFKILPWSGPVFGSKMLFSGPDVLIYMANQGRFLMIKSLRFVNAWREGEHWDYREEVK